MKKVIVLITILILISLACSFGGLIGSGNPTLEAPSGGIVFQDDFSNPNSGWPTVQDSEGITEYVNGGYRIYVTGEEFDYFSALDKPALPADVSLEVDARRVSGPDENKFGVICRYSEDNGSYNFYFMWASSRQVAAIGKFFQSKRTYMTDIVNWKKNPVILSGNSINHIRGDCIGNTLTLYVNGTELLTAKDNQFKDGYAGLISGTYTGYPNTEVPFDNFVIRSP